MRWEDERYVRLYTRDTGDWLFLSFDAQAVFMMVLRKVDRAGILHLGKHGLDAVAVTLGHAESRERIGPAIKLLIADGTVALEGDKLVVPNFIEAQEARTTDAQRKRDQRERDRDKLTSREIPGSKAGHDTVAKADRASHVVTPVVTPSHTESRAVTPSLAVPSRTEPEKKEPIALLVPAEPAPPPTPFVTYLRSAFPTCKNPHKLEARAKDAWPGVDITGEAKKARVWEETNPTRVKKNKAAFLARWFDRAQERPAGMNGHATPAVPSRAPSPIEQAQREAARAVYLRHKAEQEAAERELAQRRVACKA